MGAYGWPLGGPEDIRSRVTALERMECGRRGGGKVPSWLMGRLGRYGSQWRVPFICPFGPPFNGPLIGLFIGPFIGPFVGPFIGPFVGSEWR